MPTHEYRFTVEARHEFPVDMLRYDRATPLSEEDSGIIGRSIMNRSVPAQHKVPAVIRLRSPKEPATGRWRSFGWTVTKIEKVRVG